MAKLFRVLHHICKYIVGRHAVLCAKSNRELSFGRGGRAQ